jgi:hypothetical protein
MNANLSETTSILLHTASSWIKLKAVFHVFCDRSDTKITGTMSAHLRKIMITILLTYSEGLNKSLHL